METWVSHSRRFFISHFHCYFNFPVKMLKWFIISCCLLTAISYSTYYLFTSNSWIKTVKTHTYSRFYQLIKENTKTQLDRLQEEAKLSGKSLIPPFINFDREYAVRFLDNVEKSL